MGKDTKGSCLMFLVLSMLLVIPGIIYLVWTLTSFKHRCPVYRSFDTIPENSPAALVVINKEKV
jgi:hypothetical protein